MFRIEPSTEILCNFVMGMIAGGQEDPETIKRCLSFSTYYGERLTVTQIEEIVSIIESHGMGRMDLVQGLLGRDNG